MTKLWVSGHNLSGYSPMNAPWLTTTWESAREDCAEAIDRTIQSLWDGLSMSLDKIVPLDEAEQWGATEMLDWWFGGNDRWVPWAELNAQDRTERFGDEDQAMFESGTEAEQWEIKLHAPIYTLTESDFYILRDISDGESSLDTCRGLEPGQSFCGEVGNENYWFEESDRSSNEIPEDLEGEELEELVDKLNEQGY